LYQWAVYSLVYSPTLCGPLADHYCNFTGTTPTCDASCLNCVCPSVCTQCPLNHYASGPDCLPCTNSGCSECEGYASFCAACYPGYVLFNNDCKRCSSFMPGCANCSSTSVCTACDSLHLQVNQSTCLACSSLMPHCGSCSSMTTCTNCQNGYYLGSVTGNCTSCNVGHCSLYSHGCTCGSCSPGYYLQSTGNFTNCRDCGVTHCTLYSSSSVCVCLNCAAGFQINGQGTACNDCNVVGCTSYSSLCSCNACQTTGYQLNGIRCDACYVSQCMAFPAGGGCTCTACNPGYQLTSSGGTTYCAYIVSSSGNGSPQISAAIATVESNVGLLSVFVALLFHHTSI